MDLYVDQDEQHVITQSRSYPQRYDVTTATGTPVGAVYFVLRGGFRCWWFGRSESTVVPSLGRALAHYRDDS